MDYDVESPCNSVCIYDDDLDMCISCKRTIEEISSWKNISVIDKLQILERIEKQQKEEENN